MDRLPALSVAAALFLILFLNSLSGAEEQKSTGEGLVVCMIRLEHADAEELAAVLQPRLSPEGSIVPYRPTNTLIIKDRVPVVDKLSIAIKGRPCAPIADPPEGQDGNVKEQPRID